VDVGSGQVNQTPPSRILKGLLLERHLAVGCPRNRGVGQAFALMLLITRTRIACWYSLSRAHSGPFGTKASGRERCGEGGRCGWTWRSKRKVNRKTQVQKPNLGTLRVSFDVSERRLLTWATRPKKEWPIGRRKAPPSKSEGGAPVSRQATHKPLRLRMLFAGCAIKE
jgi:hypothetical protein